MAVPATETNGLLATTGASDQKAQAFVDLITSDLNRLYRLAGMLIGNSADAEEATGVAIERAWRRLDQLQDAQLVRPWLDRILVNECRDRLRSGRRRRLLSLDAMTRTSHDLEDSRDPFAAALAADGLGRALAQLSPDERAVVVLHYWADLTLDTTAAVLGWRGGTARSRLNRALSKMRLTLDRGDWRVN